MRAQGSPWAKAAFTVVAACAIGIGQIAGAAWRRPIDTWFASQELPTPLAAAHVAYLQGDLQRMTMAIKDVLQQYGNDARLKDNALRLLERAYDLPRRQAIGGGWKLPQEVAWLKIIIRRNESPNHTSFSLKVRGATLHPDMVEQIRLVEYPSTVVIDKRAGIGEPEVPHGENSANVFEIEAKKAAHPYPDGLYLLSLQVKGGERVDGWFITSSGTASKAPGVQVPEDEQDFNTANPTLRWGDFRSPEYKPFEKRYLFLAVSQIDKPDYQWKRVWALRDKSAEIADRDHVTIGEEPSAQGVQGLKDGRYVFFLSYREERPFGPLILSRQTSRHVTFFVHRAKANSH